MSPGLESNSSESGSHIVSLGGPSQDIVKLHWKDKQTWNDADLGRRILPSLQSQVLSTPTLLTTQTLRVRGSLNPQVCRSIQFTPTCQVAIPESQGKQAVSVFYACLPAWPAPRVQNLLEHVSRVHILVVGTQGDNQGSVFPSASGQISRLWSTGTTLPGPAPLKTNLNGHSMKMAHPDRSSHHTKDTMSPITTAPFYNVIK